MRSELHAVVLSPRKKGRKKTQTPITNWHSQLNKAVRFPENACGSEEASESRLA
jgi:hypothetical protein